MYSTCLFCSRPLGHNESIEHFPVGRRLAFDAAKGRLWVVCRACERWNLTPLEERWEAIEECERRYRDARKRVATEQVGLARIDDGVDLVRIGAPLRPEFAAWRYGDQFGRRRRRQLLRAGLGLGALGAVVAGGAAAGIASFGMGFSLWRVAKVAVLGREDAVVARLPVQGAQLTVRRKDLKALHFLRTEPTREAIALRVGHAKGDATLTGEQAIAAAQRLLPSVNRFGASGTTVARAVEEIERGGGPERFFLEAAERRCGTSFVNMAPVLRLSLEMALHEEEERRALEGELAALEERWKDAEEVAVISDSMFLPKPVEEWLRARKRGGPGE